MTKYNVSPLVAREIEFSTGTIFGGSWCRYFISITQYKKESDKIQVVTNLFIADQEQYHIQLSGNYPEESEDWNKFLEENQWKIYPLYLQI